MAAVNSDVVTDAPVEGAEGLPSEQANPNPWDFGDRVDENGMVAGKYKDVDGLLKSLEHAEAKLTELQGEKQSTTDLAANAEKAAEAETAKVGLSADLVKQALEGGMTEEISLAATEAGISPESIELAAIKGQQHIDKMTAVVGGPEVYQEMMTDMGATMSDAEKAQFTKDVQGSMSEYAVRGIHAAWLQSKGQAPASKRIEGSQPGSSSSKPYASQAELMKDLRYLKTRGQADRGAWAAHEKRKAATPDSVIYGR